MKIIKDLFSYSEEGPAVITVGKFDGIHRGHRRLVLRTSELVSRTVAGEDGGGCLAAVRGAGPALPAEAPGEEAGGWKSVVLSFDMNAPMILAPGERRRMLGEMGTDILVESRFGPEIASMEAERFVEEILLGRMHMKGIVVGEDFRFGHGRRGDGELLARLGASQGFFVEVLPEVMEGGRPVSSTRVRDALAAGDVEAASCLLGYPYACCGTIVHGQGLARTMEMRTINFPIPPSKMLPRHGVYVSDTAVGGRVYRGVTNVGLRPTVNGTGPVCETNLFDFEGDLYGAEACVRLLHFVRDERKFPDIASLAAQMERDSEEARAFFT